MKWNWNEILETVSTSWAHFQHGKTVSVFCFRDVRTSEIKLQLNIAVVNEAYIIKTPLLQKNPIWRTDAILEHSFLSCHYSWGCPTESRDLRFCVKSRDAKSYRSDVLCSWFRYDIDIKYRFKNHFTFQDTMNWMLHRCVSKSYVEKVNILVRIHEVLPGDDWRALVSWQCGRRLIELVIDLVHFVFTS